MSVNGRMNRTEWTMLVALSILWGGSFFFIGVAVKELPPITIVTLRVFIAAIALLSVCRLLGYSIPRKPEVLGAFVIMGLLNNIIPFSLIVWARRILQAASPPFSMPRRRSSPCLWPIC